MNLHFSWRTLGFDLIIGRFCLMVSLNPTFWDKPSWHGSLLGNPRDLCCYFAFNCGPIIDFSFSRSGL